MLTSQQLTRGWFLTAAAGTAGNMLLLVAIGLAAHPIATAADCPSTEHFPTA